MCKYPWREPETLWKARKENVSKWEDFPYSWIKSHVTSPDKLETECDPIKNSKSFWAGCWWLTPIILATQEAEIRRISVWSQPGQIVHRTLSRKNLHKKMAGGVAQGAGLEFKLLYYKNKSFWITQAKFWRWNII
jgi:hypothetical protein